MKKNKLIIWSATVMVVFTLATSCMNNNKSNTMNSINQKITPCLWVEKDAKAVADYYLSIFKDGKLKDFRRFSNDESGNDAGSLRVRRVGAAGGSR